MAVDENKLKSRDKNVNLLSKNRYNIVFSIFPVMWDRVGNNFNGRVPGYSFRWAIIGIRT